VKLTVTDDGGANNIYAEVLNVVPQTMHIGNLVSSSQPGRRGRWHATVTIAVHDANHAPLADVTVSGLWSGGTKGSDSCITNSNGQCDITKQNVKGSASSVTLTIDNLTHATNTYDTVDYHHGVGTVIEVLKP
jgi:hypothetical protein